MAKARHGAAGRGRRAEPVVLRVPNAEIEADHGKLVSVARLLNVNLIRVDAQLHAERMRDSGDDLLLFVHPPEYRAGLDQSAHIVQCGTKLRLQVTTDANNDASAALDITAEYILNYSVPDDTLVSEAAAHLLAARTAVFNAWPFFRELAHSTAARMNLPPLVLPLYRMPALPHPTIVGSTERKSTEAPSKAVRATRRT